VKRPKPRQRSTPAQMAEHGFKDGRSYVQWNTGRVILRGVDMTELRGQVYARAGGRCEVIKANGKRCNRFAAWDGVEHGELSHDKHGPYKTDTADAVLWSCRGCHRERHPGPQFAPQRRRAEAAGANSLGPEERLDAVGNGC
jgi:hypothetical protein